MKKIFLLYKNSFKISILVLAIGLSKVFADDCEIWNNVMMTFSESFYKDFQSKNFANCCEYSGLTCNSNFITEIKITKNMIGNIDKPKFNDEVVGHLQKLSHLTSLELSDISFKDNLSEKLGYLTNLETLILKKDFLKGNIPDSFCNLKKLKNLDLSYNDINGYIPYGFKNLENLENLNLEGNFSMKGYVPLIPNLKICNYKYSDLCYLENEKCDGFGEYKLIHGCSKDLIKETNKNNGNPNPDSDEFENEDVESGNNDYNDESDYYSRNDYYSSKSKYYGSTSDDTQNYIKLIIKIIGVVITISALISICNLKKKEKKKKEMEDAKELIDNNNNNHNNDAPSNTNLNIQPVSNADQTNGSSSTPFTPSYYTPPASTSPYVSPYTPPAPTTPCISPYIPPASLYISSATTTPYTPSYYPTNPSIPSVPPTVHLDTTTSNLPPYSPPDSTLPNSNYTSDKKTSKN